MQYIRKLQREAAVRNLTCNQVYSYSETRLNWEALSQTTLASSSHASALGYKARKELNCSWFVRCQR